MKLEILLLSGSYRGNKTTSNSILNYLSQHIENKDYSIKQLKLSSRVPDNANDDCIFNHINSADLIVLCSPKYNLSLPAPVMYLFEILHQRKNELKKKKENLYQSFNLKHLLVVRQLKRCAVVFQIIWDSVGMGI